MSSGARTRTREEERRLSIRTLAIASVASATAAIVTSQFWTSGTPLAAAVTPVIVALVSELLHRPTTRIVERFTQDGPAVLPDAAGAAPPAPPHEHPLPNRAPPEPGTAPPPAFERGRPVPGSAERRAGRPPGAAPPVRVYRRRAPRRRFAVGVVALTALLAFVLAAAALTLPELIAGQSLGKSDRHTTLFGGKERERDEPKQQEQEEPTQTAPEDGAEQQEQQQQPTTPEEGTQPDTQEQEAPQGGASTSPAPAPSPSTPGR